MTKRNLIISLVIAIIAVAVILWYSPGSPSSSEAGKATITTIATSTASTTSAESATSTPASAPLVRIDGQTIAVDLALTQDQQALGLGGRTGLGDHRGMLFVFPSDALHMFWMKDMHFSIDMIWFSSDGTVLYIQPNVSPSTYPEAFGPKENSRYVLEVAANFASEYDIKVGDRAILP